MEGGVAVDLDEEGGEGSLETAVSGVGDGVDEDYGGGVGVEEEGEASKGVGDVGVLCWC